MTKEVTDNRQKITGSRKSITDCSFISTAFMLRHAERRHPETGCGKSGTIRMQIATVCG
jgi:hypothetical protein